MALVNPAIRARTVVEIFTATAGTSYPWSEQARAAARRLDFVAHAGLISGRNPPPAVLVVSGELDYPTSRADAHDLVPALQAGYPDTGRVRLSTIAGLEHPLAEPPGLEPAPPTPLARAVDRVVSEWFQANQPSPSCAARGVAGSAKFAHHGRAPSHRRRPASGCCSSQAES
ncbi:hypothetical protein QOZ89_09000 [Pseudofrankia sp. BMG5.37]|nr:hypothetical protein [Pseudofrankia sp. BMG5.37]MDT3439746.1 hypothetical protein [Pseudofrankia sp. BMG5.37]